MSGLKWNITALCTVRDAVRVVGCISFQCVIASTRMNGTSRPYVGILLLSAKSRFHKLGTGHGNNKLGGVCPSDRDAV